MKEQDTRVSRREVEPWHIVKLVARVVSMSHKIDKENNFELVYFGSIDGGEKECGRSWEEYTIEATVALTDAPQNKDYHLQRLIFYAETFGSREIKNAYLRKVKALTLGNTVLLTVHSKALKEHNDGFTRESEAVNLRFVDVKELPTLHL